MFAVGGEGGGVVMNDFAFVAVLLAVRTFTFVASHDLAFQFKTVFCLSIVFVKESKPSA